MFYEKLLDWFFSSDTRVCGSNPVKCKLYIQHLVHANYCKNENKEMRERELLFCLKTCWFVAGSRYHFFYGSFERTGFKPSTGSNALTTFASTLTLFFCFFDNCCFLSLPVETIMRMSRKEFNFTTCDVVGKGKMNHLHHHHHIWTDSQISKISKVSNILWTYQNTMTHETYF